MEEHEAISAIMPKVYDPETDKRQEDIIKFKNYNNSFKHPVAVFLDFESTLSTVTIRDDQEEKLEKLLENIDDENNKNKIRDDFYKKLDKSTTKPLQKHVANSCGLKFNCIHNEYTKDVKILNNPIEDKLLEETINELEDYAKYSYKLFQQNKKTPTLLNNQQIIHENTKCCHECKQTFSAINKKVIHHDHITGNYISTICNECNLNLRLKNFLPIYIHNLKGYDSHYLIKALAKYGYQEGDKELIGAIPSNEQKYISFSKDIKVDYKNGKPIYFELRFLDSIAFMPSSLSELVNNLNPLNDQITKKYEIVEKVLEDINDENKKIKIIDDFHNDIYKMNFNQITELRKIYKNTSSEFIDDEQFLLMITKGIYPYDYITSYDKLFETQLPQIEDFYSNLNNEECSLLDYRKAQLVYNKFSCKTLLDYHNIYLNSDVLLLADIFETFKEVCYKIYGLDVSYYYTAPGLSWDAFLKHTKEEYKRLGKGEFKIDLLTDIDI